MSQHQLLIDFHKIQELVRGLPNMRPDLIEALADAASGPLILERAYALTRMARDAKAACLADYLLSIISAVPGEAESLRFQLERAQALILAGNLAEAGDHLLNLRSRFPSSDHSYRLAADLSIAKRQYGEALSALLSSPIADSSSDLNEDTVFRAIKLKIYLASEHLDIAFNRPSMHDALQNIMVVMMLRDEADIIGCNLEHQYSLGVRNFVLLLNCCTDSTASLIDEFRHRHDDVIVCLLQDFVEGYYQSGKTQAAVDFGVRYLDAVGRPVDWCFILDGDEFIALPNEIELKDVLAAAESSSKDYIAFHLCNACPSSGDDYRAGSDLYMHFDTVATKAVPIVPKVAFRAALRPRIAMGNHSLFYKGITANKGLIAAEHGACLVHLPYRSVSQVRSKIINGGSAYQASNLHPGLGAHWRRLFSEYQQCGERVFRRQMENYNSQTMAAAQAPRKPFDCW